MRGLAKVEEQCLLTAAVQNMKKIATVLHRLGRHLFSTTNTLIQKLIHATKPAKMRALSVI